MVIIKSLAVRQVTQFVHEVSLVNSIFEEYSKIILNSLQKNDMVDSTFGHLVKALCPLLILFKVFTSLTFISKVMLNNALAGVVVLGFAGIEGVA